MENKFSDIMSQHSDSELLKIVNEQKDDYQIDAVEAAKHELNKRNLSSEEIKLANNLNELKTKVETEKANIKLDSVWKVLTFIFPGIIQIIFAGTFKSEGYDRKAKELARWTLYGFGFYLGIVVLIILLESIF